MFKYCKLSWFPIDIVKKDLKLAKKQGKDTEKLFEVIEKLANGEVLEEKYRDHDLTGNYKGCRNATLNLIGCLCMRLLMMYLF